MNSGGAVGTVFRLSLIHILDAKLVPADATDVKLAYESSDESIATVDETGKVTAVEMCIRDRGSPSDGGTHKVLRHVP